MSNPAALSSLNTLKADASSLRTGQTTLTKTRLYVAVLMNMTHLCPTTYAFCLFPQGCRFSAQANGTLAVEAFDLSSVFSYLTVGTSVKYTGHSGPSGVSVKSGEPVVFSVAPSIYTTSGFKICYVHVASGGGLYVTGGLLKIEDASIDGNFATANGGGIFLGGGVSLLMFFPPLRCRHFHHEAHLHFCTPLCCRQDINLVNVEIHDNEVGLEGSAAHISSGSFTGSNLRIKGSFAGETAQTATCGSSCNPGSYGVCETASGGDNCYIHCDCLLCPAGKLSSSAGSVSEDSCDTCGVGQVSQEGSSECYSCEPGKYATDDPNDTSGGLSKQVVSGASFCNECPPQTFSPSSGTLVCQLCGATYSSGFGDTSCKLAKEGYYIEENDDYTDFDSDAVVSGILSVACPDGALCAGGEEQPRPQMDFWVEVGSRRKYSASVIPCKW